MATEDNTDRLVWVDLEMTGLDPEVDKILEFAMVITDANLKILDLMEGVVAYGEGALYALNPDPIVLDMHKENRLWDDVDESKESLRTIEQKAMKILTKHVPYGEGYLAGNSIHTDRKFLEKHMPLFEGYLNYRQLDVTAFKLAYRMHQPDHPALVKGENAHRAMADVMESIDEYRRYLRATGIANCPPHPGPKEPA
jgi:oligoribonuclease